MSSRSSPGHGSHVGGPGHGSHIQDSQGSALAIVCGWIAGCSGSAAGQNRRGGPPSVAVQTTATKRMTVQRQVDLAGTLISPDQAKVSAEAAGIVRSVLVEIGREVRVGDPLVRLEPRELALALARAESALRQTRAQLGMPDALDRGRRPAARRRDRIGQERAGQPRGRARQCRAGEDALGARADLAGRYADRRHAAEGGRGGVPVGRGHGARSEGAAAGPPRRPTTSRRKSSTTPLCARRSPASFRSVLSMSANTSASARRSRRSSRSIR